MQKTINEDTPISLFTAGALIVGSFALYQIFGPSIEQVKVNASEIKNNHELIRLMQSSLTSQNSLLLKISNQLARVEGKLEKP